MDPTWCRSHGGWQWRLDHRRVLEVIPKRTGLCARLLVYNTPVATSWPHQDLVDAMWAAEKMAVKRGWLDEMPLH